MASGKKQSWYVINGRRKYIHRCRPLKDILTPEKPKDKTYAELREALLSHYSPKPLIIDLSSTKGVRKRENLWLTTSLH